MIVCDRCGAKVREKDAYDTVHEIKQLRYGSPFLFTKKETHLCPNCMISFSRWWKKGTSRKNSNSDNEKDGV